MGWGEERKRERENRRLVRAGGEETREGRGGTRWRSQHGEEAFRREQINN